MSKKVAIVALVAAVGLTACSSGDEPVESAPSSSSSSSPASDAKASATPSESGEPKALTRKEGAAKYLEIVKPFNDEMDRCYFKLVYPVLESMSSGPDDYPKIRKDCAEMGDANRKFAKDLEAVKWPAEAQESINMLVDQTRADQLAWDEMARVRTHDDLFNPKFPLQEDGGAAGLVRAHLGLPPVEEVD